MDKPGSAEAQAEIKKELEKKKIAAGVDPKWAKHEAEQGIWHADASKYKEREKAIIAAAERAKKSGASESDVEKILKPWKK